MKRTRKLRETGRRVRHALADEFEPELDTVQEKGHEVMDRVRHTAQDMERRFERHVKEYPLGSLVISALIGAVAAFMMGAGSRRRY